MYICESFLALLLANDEGKYREDISMSEEFQHPVNFQTISGQRSGLGS